MSETFSLWPKPAPALDAAAQDGVVHPRVLRLSEAGGGEAYCLLLWRTLQRPEALQRAVQQAIEATLLAELSACPPTKRPPPVGLRLLSPAPLPAPARAALQSLSLAPEPHRQALDTWWPKAQPRLRHEASLAAQALPEHCPQAYWLPIRCAPAIGTDALSALDAALHTALADAPFGQRPGHPTRALLTALHQQGHLPHAALDAGTLPAIEAALSSSALDTLRWLPPRLFQALSDLIGTCAVRLHDLPLAWAEAQHDAAGRTTAPLLRRACADGRTVLLPVGLHLLRWWIMPRRPGEDIAPMHAWLADWAAGE
ncbi:MAG: hypothetical protein ACPGUV_04800 [Polyangiales bacterium]